MSKVLVSSGMGRFAESFLLHSAKEKRNLIWYTGAYQCCVVILITRCTYLNVIFCHCWIHLLQLFLGSSKNVICWMNFLRKFASLDQEVSHPPRLLIGAGKKHGRTCRWNPAEVPIHSANCVSIVMGMSSEFSKFMSSRKLIIAQDSAPCRM